VRRGIEQNVCTSEIRSAMYIIPIMSDIRGIITADFDYAEYEVILVNELSHCYRNRKFTRNQSEPFSPLLTFASASALALTLASLLLSRFHISTSLFSLSIVSPFLSFFTSHIRRRLSTIVNIGYPLWNIGWYRIFDVRPI